MESIFSLTSLRYSAATVATSLSLKMVDAESILEDWLPQASLYSRDMFHQSFNASVAMTRRVYEVLGLR